MLPRVTKDLLIFVFTPQFTAFGAAIAFFEEASLGPAFDFRKEPSSATMLSHYGILCY